LSSVQLNTWQNVQTEVLERIHSRQWKSGDLIPSEEKLANEFGCARATVNRALRAVAELGLLERKRKAGTRVATTPVRKATLSIPIIRQEIEDSDLTYSYELISVKNVTPPAKVHAKMNLKKSAKTLKITSALRANKTIANRMDAKLNDALFVIDRTTWNDQVAITSVRMIFHADYQMQTTL